MPRSLGWKRFDHYSIVAKDAEKMIEFHKKLFGLEEAEEIDSPDKGFSGAVLDMPGRQAQIEVLAPAGKGSFLDKFLDERGPGVHHITIEVEDVDAAAVYLREEMGIEPHGGVWSDGEWRQTFIHPKDTGGVLYQLFEWEPGKGPADLRLPTKPKESA